MPLLPSFSSQVKMSAYDKCPDCVCLREIMHLEVMGASCTVAREGHPMQVDYEQSQRCCS